MERMVASYQEKLDSVTTSYQEKVNILEGRLVDKELSAANGGGHHVSRQQLYHSQGELSILSFIQLSCHNLHSPMRVRICAAASFFETDAAPHSREASPWIKFWA